jgi:dTDP-4-amino-4,6-dideoxygalactose transaminase
MADVPGPTPPPGSSSRPRDTVLPLRRPWINRAEVEAVARVLRSETLVGGTRTQEFEARFAGYVGAAHAVAVSSGPAALHLALDSVGVRAGDEVITSVAASVAVAAAIDRLGARPVLVDVDPVSLAIDHREIERHLTPRTRAIVPVHFGGRPCEMDEILALAAEHNVRVVEDASHALSARYRGRSVGSIGDVTVFAFDPARTMTTGEGGMLTTDRAEYAELWRAQRADGVPEGAAPATGPERAPFGDARYRGYGYRMTEVSAVLGIAQLMRVPRFHGIRSYYATLYQLGLGDLPELTLAEAPEGNQHAWDLYVIRLDSDRLTIDRDRFIDLLLAEKIQAGLHFVPLFAHTYYRDTFGYRGRDFPHAARAYARVVSLPLYPRMAEADVWDVIQAIRRIVTAHRPA